MTTPQTPRNCALQVNSETEWALKHWGFECPSPVEDVLAANPEANVCLVDFQQLTQLNPAIAERRVVGVVSSGARLARVVSGRSTDRPPCTAEFNHRM